MAWDGDFTKLKRRTVADPSFHPLSDTSDPVVVVECESSLCCAVEVRDLLNFVLYSQLENEGNSAPLDDWDWCSTCRASSIRAIGFSGTDT